MGRPDLTGGVSDSSGRVRARKKLTVTLTLSNIISTHQRIWWSYVLFCVECVNGDDSRYCELFRALSQILSRHYCNVRSLTAGATSYGSKNRCYVTVQALALWHARHCPVYPDALQPVLPLPCIIKSPECSTSTQTTARSRHVSVKRAL
jgi:hypothetical protein